MKLSRNKKIILLISTMGILTTSILVPIVVLNNKEDQIEKKEDEIEKDISSIEIKSKIKNKELIIPKNIKTFSDEEILLAIKNQLKKQNPSLTNNDLSKIIDNVWHLKPGKKTFVTLTIKSQGLMDSIKVNVTKEKNIKLWTKSSAIVKNFKIINGEYASFIQDSSGNFWAMGSYSSFGYGPNNRTKLQVLKRDGNQWEEDITSGLTKGSNIIDGTNGVIFEDDFGNIWSMGKGTKLQVLVKNKDGTFANSWANDNGEGGEKLLQGSKINDGHLGTILQDSFGNLWAMSKGTKLQVLVKNKDGSYASSWKNDNSKNSKELLRNSKIKNGEDGTIFQDSFGNLWAIGRISGAQILKMSQNGLGYENSWITDKINTPILKYTGTRNGGKNINTKFFQDKFKNLWLMLKGASPRVMRAKSDGSGYLTNRGWVDEIDYKLSNVKWLKGSNIVDGLDGTFFQDSFGNLWAMAWKTSNSKTIQVLKAKSNGSGYDLNDGWNSDYNQGLLKNSKVSSGNGGVIFQDSSKNLWVMAEGTKLQVLKAKLDGSGYDLDVGWIDNNNKNNGDELLKNSNITSGENGVIFEDSSKNLWAVGFGTLHFRAKLQVYDKTLKRWKS